MRIVQDVLIGFVTNHDPQSLRGLANIATAVKALSPQVVYLLYTEETRPNYEQTKQWIESDSELQGIDVPDMPSLNLPDVTNYRELARVIREELSKIEQNHPGAHFHLVSGLCQARVVFALCLFATKLNGTLWEVNPPASPEETSKESCKKRLEPWPIAIFHEFFKILYQRFGQVRLYIDVDTKEAKIDGRPMAFRVRVASKDLGSRTFQTLVVLAAKKKYGAGDEVVTAKTLRNTVYKGANNPSISIHQAIDNLNAQAAKLSQGAKPPLSPLVVREKGGYKLTDGLNPPTIAIEFVGSLREYLRSLGIKPDLFPALPPF